MVIVSQKPQQMAAKGVVQTRRAKHLFERITQLVQTFLEKVASGVLTLEFSPKAPTSEPNPQDRQKGASHYRSNKRCYGLPVVCGET